MLNRRPWAHSAGWWLFLLHLITIFSGPHSTGPQAPSAWCSFPYHISSITRLIWPWNSNLTELYNSSTPTWSPTRSLKSHVQSSSSGNNCHAVQRSPSSGASVYESIMGFFSLSHFVSQFPPTRFPLLTAIGMCHFLPVHHLEWHFGPARRAKYNTSFTPVWPLSFRPYKNDAARGPVRVNDRLGQSTRERIERLPATISFFFLWR